METPERIPGADTRLPAARVVTQDMGMGAEVPFFSLDDIDVGKRLGARHGTVHVQCIRFRKSRWQPSFANSARWTYEVVSRVSGRFRALIRLTSDAMPTQAPLITRLSTL